jgi:hypothetical protein
MTGPRGLGLPFVTVYVPSESRAVPVPMPQVAVGPLLTTTVLEVGRVPFAGIAPDGLVNVPTVDPEVTQRTMLDPSSTELQEMWEVPDVVAGDPAVQASAVMVYVQPTVTVWPAMLHGANRAVPVAALQNEPTNDVPTVPVTSADVHVRLLPPTESVVAPPVAVNAVLPVLCQVTAFVVVVAIANSDSSAVSVTPSLMVLLMVLLLVIEGLGGAGPVPHNPGVVAGSAEAI